MPAVTVPVPDLVRVQLGPHDGWSSPAAVTVGTTSVGSALEVTVAAGTDVGVSRVHLRWRRPVTPGVLVLGDAWERSYGDLQWTGLRPQRPLPWYALVHDPATGTSWGAGVQVRTGSFAMFTVDPDGLSLWLDVRSGGRAVRLGDRALTAATVHFSAAEGSAYAAQQDLCGLLCPNPLPVGPLVGANNWYYAYGQNFDQAAVVRDAATVADLVGDHPVRPYGVIDDGWSVDGVADGRLASGGPWDRSRPATFPDMAEAAAAIAAQGVRPGIWFRPLLARAEPAAGALGPSDGGTALDPSHPATLETVFADVARIRDWGYELIKHDFSGYELFGRWGFQMAPSPAADSLALYDIGRTTAEVLVDFYATVRRAAGPAVVLGCNVVGHLAAGLVEAQRTGDDTSGKVWERTRRMGVNTLAFRLAQHRRFFAVDADCVPSTFATPWDRNRQFLDLIARSGTVLFVSVDPATRTDAVDADLSAALRLALDGGVPGGTEPLDWLHTTTPSHWRGGGEELGYSWFEESGPDAYDWEFTAPIIV